MGEDGEGVLYVVTVYSCSKWVLLCTQIWGGDKTHEIFIWKWGCNTPLVFPLYYFFPHLFFYYYYSLLGTRLLLVYVFLYTAAWMTLSSSLHANVIEIFYLKFHGCLWFGRFASRPSRSRKLWAQRNVLHGIQTGNFLSLTLWHVSAIPHYLRAPSFIFFKRLFPESRDDDDDDVMYVPYGGPLKSALGV